MPGFALPDPQVAPWKTAFGAMDGGVMVTVTGFDHATFQFLPENFQPHHNSFTPGTGKNDGHNHRRLRHPVNTGKGRRRITSAEACLGLVLAWHRFRGAECTLQGWFGFAGGHTSVWLRFGRRMLLKELLNVKEAKVKMPDDATVCACMDAVFQRHDALHGVCCTCDGLKIPFQSCHGLSEQSAFHNGWLHGHFMTNLFAADGRIINAVLSTPGSMHDSTLACFVKTHKKLKAMHRRTGGVCCVDWAFAAACDASLPSPHNECHLSTLACFLGLLSFPTPMPVAMMWLVSCKFDGRHPWRLTCFVLI